MFTNFTEATNLAGVAYTGRSFGAAWGDFNKDNFPDLWVINHALPDQLFLNQGNGTFADITSSIFSADFADTHGPAWADFDNDGDLDIAILLGAAGQTGPGKDNRLYVNKNGVLVDEAQTRGIAYPLGRGRTPTWVDYNNDGLLDLWIGNLARQDRQAKPTLFKQTNNNTFVDVRQQTGIKVGQSDFAILSDLTGDGKLDIINRGFDPSNSFEKLTVYDISTSPFQNVVNSLLPSGLDADDIVAADFNNDLKMDLYLADNDGDTLLINNGNKLINTTASSGISSAFGKSHGVVAGDFDNDMDVDLYILKGSQHNNTANIFYENQGNGTFNVVTNAGAAGSSAGSPDSVTVADYDRDGFLDLFTTNGDHACEPCGPSQLFRNQGNQNNWIEIVLEGTVSNRDGIGAQVFVTAGGVTQLREQSGGVHKVAQNSTVLHFGLGSNTTIEEVLIKWPSGIEQTLSNVSVNQLIQIQESAQTSNLVSLSATQNGSEPNSDGKFTVSLNNAASSNTVIAYSVAGSATSGADYTALSGNVTIPAGSLSALINVDVLNDSLDEGSETVTVTLNAISSGDSNVTIGSAKTATVTISDDDSSTTGDLVIPINLITDDREEFGWAGSPDLEFGLNGSSLQTVGLRFNGIDIPAGASIANAYISFTADESNSAPASFTIGIQNSENATTFTSSANLLNRTIAADLAWSNVEAWTVGQTYATPNLATLIEQVIGADGVSNGSLAFLIDGSGSRVAESFNKGTPPELIIEFGDTVPSTPEVTISATQDGAEPSTDGVFTVQLSEAANSNTVISYTAGGSATEGTDYTPLNGTVTIAGGSTSATINVDVLNDSNVEGNETVTLTLDSITSGNSNIEIGAADTATVTIGDDDSSTGANLIIPINSITDDREEFGWAGSPDLEFGLNGSSLQTVGLRFNGVDIPAGASIANAYISFTADESNSAPASFTIGIQNSENATTFTSSADLLSRTIAADLAWSNVEAWSVGQTYTTPNLATLIEQVIGADGVSNGSLAFLIDGSGSRVAESFNRGTPPQLVVEFGGAAANSLAVLNSSVVVGADSNTQQNTAAITIQGENADIITGYRIEEDALASGGSILSLADTGSAHFVFGDTPDELLGIYDVEVGIFDDSDGVSRFTLELEDFETGLTTEIGSLELDSDSASLGATSPQTFQIATEINLAAGDTLIVSSFADSAGPARLDFINFTPVI